jgi:hypothetical protein
MAIVRWAVCPLAIAYPYTLPTTWSSTIDGMTTPASVPTNTQEWGLSAICVAGASLVSDTATNSCKGFDLTGAPANFKIQLSQNLNYGTDGVALTATVTVISAVSKYLRANGAGDCPLTINGADVTRMYLEFLGVTANIKLMDDLNIGNSQLYAASGQFTTQNHSVTCGLVSDSGVATNQRFTLGSSTFNCDQWNFYGAGVLAVDVNTATINCAGTFAGKNIATYNIINITGASSTFSGAFNAASLNLGHAAITCPEWLCTATALNAGTSTILVTNAGAVARTFVGGSHIYNIVIVAGAGNFALTVTGNNAMRLEIDGTVAKTIIATGTTQTVGSMTRLGSAAITIVGGTWVASVTGAIILYNMNISNSTAVGTFYAGATPPSVNGGGNAGWIFTLPVYSHYKAKELSALWY